MLSYMIYRFAELTSHDSEYGAVTGVVTSFDDQYLLSVGHDGQFYVNRMKNIDIEALAVRKPTKYEDAEEEPGSNRSRTLTTQEALLKGNAFDPISSSALFDAEDEVGQEEV